MATKLRGTFQDFEIRAEQDLQPDEVALRFSDAVFALRFLRGFLRDPLAMADLRQVAAGGRWTTPFLRYSDQEILRQLAWQLATGRLCVVPLERTVRYLPSGTPSRPSAREEPTEEAPREAPAQPPPAPPQESKTPVKQATTHWVTFQLVDDDTEAPLANVDLRLRLPDGTVSTYTTDGDGVVRLADLPDGTCDLEKVLDEEAFEVVAFE